MSEENGTKAPAAGMWAIVEIFGHQRIAGWMTEQTIAGHGFIRVDVPEIRNEHKDATTIEGGVIAAHSKLFGPGAIYAINPVDEALARIAAKNIRHAPVTPFGLESVLRNMPDEQRQRLLAGPDGDDD